MLRLRDYEKLGKNSIVSNGLFKETFDPEHKA